MIRQAKDLRRYWTLLIWPAISLIQIGMTRGFRELLRPVYWQLIGFCLLVLVLLAAALALVFLAYRQTCRWFNHAFEAARARVEDRVAARSGLVTWPDSDPLHDPELDG